MTRIRYLTALAVFAILTMTLMLLAGCDSLSTATPPSTKGSNLATKPTATPKPTVIVAPTQTEAATVTPIAAPSISTSTDSSEWGVIKYNLDIIEKPQNGAKVINKLKVDTLVAFEQKLFDNSWYMLAGGGWVSSDSVKVYQSKAEALQGLPQPTQPAATVAPIAKPQIQTPPPGGVVFTAVNGGKPGSYASVSLKAIANTACSISYVTPRGTQSTAKGLDTKTTDANGNVSWSWSIGSSTQPGTGTVRVICGGVTGSTPIVIS